MGKYSRLFKNSVQILIGGGASQIVSFLMLPLYTRWLSKEAYGLTDILSVYSSLLLGLVTFCVADAIFVFPKNSDEPDRKKYFTTGLLGSLVNFAVLALLFWLLSWLGRAQGWQNVFFENIWYIYWMIVSTFLQTYSQQFACALDKIKTYSYTGLVRTLSLALLSFLLIPGYKVFGYVLAIILSNLISALYAFAFSRSFRYFSFRDVDTGRYKEMLRYSIPLIPNAIIWWLVSSLNRPIMEKYVGLAAIGIYAVANKFPTLISTVFTYFANSWQISVVEEYGKDGFKSFFNQILKAVVLGLFGLAWALSVFSKEIIQLMTQPDFYEAAQYVPALAFAVALSCIGGFMGTIFVVKKKSKYFFYSSVFGAVAAIVANLIFIPWLGLPGAVLSSFLSFFVIAVSRMIYAGKFVEYEDLSFYISLFLISVAFIYLLILVQGWYLRLAVSVPVIALFYFLNRRALRADFAMILSQFRKRT